MKKKLKLNELKIQSFKTSTEKKLKGGLPLLSVSCTCTIWQDSNIICGTEIPTIDIPTVNDNCFSMYEGKCNDW